MLEAFEAFAKMTGLHCPKFDLTNIGARPLTVVGAPSNAAASPSLAPASAAASPTAPSPTALPASPSGTPSVPVILYMPLAANSACPEAYVNCFVICARAHCANACSKGVDPATASWADFRSTLVVISASVHFVLSRRHFSYAPERFDELRALTRFNMVQSREHIKAVLRQVITRKRESRLAAVST